MSKKLVYACKRFCWSPAEVVAWLNDREVSNLWAVGQTVYCLNCDGYFPAELVAVMDDDDDYPTCPVCLGSSPLDFAGAPWWREDLTSDHRAWRKGKSPPLPGTIGVLPRVLQ